MDAALAFMAAPSVYNCAFDDESPVTSGLFNSSNVQKYIPAPEPKAQSDAIYPSFL